MIRDCRYPKGFIPDIKKFNEYETRLFKVFSEAIGEDTVIEIANHLKELALSKKKSYIRMSIKASELIFKLIAISHALSPNSPNFISDTVERVLPREVLTKFQEEYENHQKQIEGSNGSQILQQ